MIDVLINGKWENIKASVLKTDSNHFPYKNGVYETIKVEHNQAIFLEPHLQRLFYNASRVSLSIKYKKNEIKNQITQVIDKIGTPNQLVRLTLIPNKFLVFSEPFVINKNIYNGVKAMTVLAKRKNPEIKSTENETAFKAWKAAIKSSCFESILIDQKGNVYEGSRSNLFWVKNNIVFTRENDVLPGITRQAILNSYESNISFGILNIKNLKNIDELFITKTSCGIVPIIKVNNINIGNSIPGEKTLELIRLYDSWSKQNK